MASFVENVVAAHEWAARNGATVHITKTSGIDGGDGRVWGSFVISTVGTRPGMFAKENPVVVDFFHKFPDDFDFMVGEQ